MSMGRSPMGLLELVLFPITEEDVGLQGDLPERGQAPQATGYIELR